MLTTFFAPAGRADEQDLSQQHSSVLQASFITAVLDSVTDMVLVLNEQRQIIAANRRLLDAFGVDNHLQLLGLRPGEAVNCMHCTQGPDGCGTAESCSVCGAVNTIMTSQETGTRAKGECRICIINNGMTALDLEVQATPIDVDGARYTIFALKDIGSEKRRQILERTFFHDVLNTVGGLRGISELLADSESLTPETEAEYKGWMLDLSDNLVEEIKQQRSLLEAERGEYVPDSKETDLVELLSEVCQLYSNHIRTPDRTVILEKIPSVTLKTDRSMLRRIVGNMVLNALEAVPAGGSVRISVDVGSDTVRISVTNPGEIPKDVQLSMFKRSFSTKSAKGRGIGTYSMKLFGERYLGGKVGFDSQNGETVFYMELPYAS